MVKAAPSFPASPIPISIAVTITEPGCLSFHLHLLPSPPVHPLVSFEQGLPHTEVIHLTMRSTTSLSSASSPTSPSASFSKVISHKLPFQLVYSTTMSYFSSVISLPLVSSTKIREILNGPLPTNPFVSKAFKVAPYTLTL